MIFVFAGTSEGRSVCEYLHRHSIEYMAFVATEYGAVCLPDSNVGRVVEGRKSTEEILDYVKSYRPDLVIDATHPFAVEVSSNIRLALSNAGITDKYIRIERTISKMGSLLDDSSGVNRAEVYDNVCMESPNRSSIESSSESSITSDIGVLAASSVESSSDYVSVVGSMEEAILRLKSTSGNILLTSGVKTLSSFMSDSDIADRIYARIIPSLDSVRLAIESGLSPRKIIAMEGPFSKEMNLALIDQLNIKVMVTKNSGKRGGFDEKLSACRDRNITCIVVENQVNTKGFELDEVIRLLGEKYNCSEHDGSEHAGSRQEDSVCVVRDLVSNVHNAYEISSDRSSKKSILSDFCRSEDDNLNKKRVSSYVKKRECSSEQIPGSREIVGISILGIGSGNEDCLTVEGLRAIKEAKVIIGAKRMLELGKAMNPFAEFFAEYDADRIADIVKSVKTDSIVVLMSGDTGFYSGATKTYERLMKLNGDLNIEASGGEVFMNNGKTTDTYRHYDIKLLPGISSLSLFSARLGIPYSDAYVTSIHGNGEEGRKKLIQRVIAGEKMIFSLVSGREDVIWLIESLRSLNKGVCIYIGYNLGYTDERIIRGRVEELTKLTLDEGLYIVAIRGRS